MTRDARAEAGFYRATEYKLDDPANPATLEVAPGAGWERVTPFDHYRPTGKRREVEAGPHLTFLNLKGVEEEQPHHYHRALILFAKRYGFLGAFQEDYLPHPVMPEGKMLIAPEAYIDHRGRLHLLDPETDGKGLLESLLSDSEWWRLRTDPAGASFSHMALPSELKFIPKRPHLNSEWWPVWSPPQFVPWEVIKEDFGALLILDVYSHNGVSVLCTREPLRRWWLSLRFFPSGDTPAKYLVSGARNSFNSYLQEVSPLVFIGEDGNLEDGWRCRSLLQAMHVMLYLDLTGDTTIKKCQSRGCPNYFRLGSQSKSIYCSERCASRASTRMRRGQEP